MSMKLNDKMRKYQNSALGKAELVAINATIHYQTVAASSVIEEEVEAAMEFMKNARDHFGEVALRRCNRIRRLFNGKYGSRSHRNQRSSTENQVTIFGEDDYLGRGSGSEEPDGEQA